MSLLKNKFDSIIWLQIQNLYNQQEPIFLGCVYIPPCNSSFYKQYDCGIFMEFEMQISMFSSKGNVIVIGDFNARTSDKDDFITNDVIQNDIHREVSEILTYETDTVLPTRVNPDKTVNGYGRKLLSLCKSSGLRILNGRHNHGLDIGYTFMGARGLSVVDYCISTPNAFHLIEKFIISNFTTFSDHAPLHLLRLKQANVNSN